MHKSKKKHYTTLYNSEVQLSESTHDKAADNKPLANSSSTDVEGLLTPTSLCTTSQPLTTCLLETAVAPPFFARNNKNNTAIFDEEAYINRNG